MFGNRETEVLVAGAGPVGMFAAMLLAERGIQVQILDEQWRTTARSYALALHPRSLELLSEAGLVDELIPNGHRIDGIAFYDTFERRAQIRFSELSSKYPFVLVLPQNMLEEGLERRLNAKHVKILWNHRLAGIDLDDKQPAARIHRMGKASTGYGVATTEWIIEKELKTKARIILGTDGHRSMVRNALDIDYEGASESQLFAVFEFNAESDEANEVRVVMDRNMTSVLWPLGDRRFRWSFQIDSTEALDDFREKSRQLMVHVGDRAFPHLDEARLAGFIEERAPWFRASIEEIRWSLMVRFERRLAAQFGRKNVWLAGDAAHLGAPVGVHSMNMGLREVDDLVRRASQVLRGAAQLDIMNGYVGRHQRDWQLLFGDLERGARAVGDAPDWVKEHTAGILHATPATGPELAHLLRQVDIQLEPES